jgi:cupin fold WbuC family metalloprotein
MNDIIRSKSILFNYNSDNFFKILFKKSLLSIRSRSRLLVHLNKKSLVQEMFIVAQQTAHMPVHRHPKNKSESYHILYGKLRIFIFNDDQSVKNFFDLDSKKNFYLRFSNPYFWHMPVVMSKFCYFKETFPGPFNKQRDVIFPKWNKIKDVQNYLCNLRNYES